MSSHLHTKVITIPEGSSTTVPVSKHYLACGKAELAADNN